MNDIIRVFPRKTKWTPTDDLAFVGEPPLFRLPNLPVYVSVTFTWDKIKGAYLVNSWEKKVRKKVRLGGPAFGNKDSEFVPGLFIKPGVTFTSRGCLKNCQWCQVPEYEGKLREINIALGYIIQDNNFLACSHRHIERVFDMLRQQKNAAVLSGGLDIDYLEAWHVELLKSIKVSELWVACDCEKDLKRLDKAADLLADFPEEKKRCYVMIGFGGEKLIDAERRLEAVYAKGFLPFCQIYRPGKSEIPNDLGKDDETIHHWFELARKWSRSAIYQVRARVTE